MFKTVRTSYSDVHTSYWSRFFQNDQSNLINNRFCKEIDQIQNHRKRNQSYRKEKRMKPKCIFSIKISSSITGETHPETDKDFKKMEIRSLEPSSNGKFNGSCKQGSCKNQFFNYEQIENRILKNLKKSMF